MDITIQSLTVAEVQRYFNADSDGVLFSLAIIDPATKQRVYDESHIQQLNNIDAKLGLDLRVEIGDFAGFAPKTKTTLEDTEKN